MVAAAVLVPEAEEGCDGLEGDRVALAVGVDVHPQADDLIWGGGNNAMSSNDIKLD